MAFCLLLLVVAGLFVRSLRVLATTEIGFDRDQVLGARVDVRSLGYSADQRQVLYRRLLDRVQALPGVESASLSLNGPVMHVLADQQLQRRRLHPADGRADVDERRDRHRGLFLDRRPAHPARPRRSAPADRARELAGHARQRDDGAAVLPGRIRSASAGPTTQHASDARRVRHRRRRGGCEVSRLGSTIPTMTYHLSGPSEDGISAIWRCARRARRALVATLRQVLAEAEPGLPVYDILPLEQRVARALAGTVVAQLTTVFSGISLLLACLGLYGTIRTGSTSAWPSSGCGLRSEPIAVRCCGS